MVREFENQLKNSSRNLHSNSPKKYSNPSNSLHFLTNKTNSPKSKVIDEKKVSLSYEPFIWA